MIAPIEDYWAKQQTDILKNTSGRSLLAGNGIDGHRDQPYCSHRISKKISGTTLACLISTDVTVVAYAHR